MSPLATDKHGLKTQSKKTEKMKNSIVPILTIALLISGYAQTPVESAEKISLPGNKPEVVDARVYAHYLMGLIYDKRGEFEEAVKEYRESLQFAPHSSPIVTQLIEDYIWLGRIYRQQGKLKEARTNLKKIIELKPKAIEAYLQLGYLYLKENLAGEGIEILEKGRELALRKSGFYPLSRTVSEDYRREIQRDIYFLLGSTYTGKEDYNRAVSVLREYLKLEPDNDVARFYLGANLERQGKRKEAVLELKKTIELNPRNAEALNYLGYLQAEQGIDLDESIKLIKRALKLKPDSDYITDSLGWAYFKKGMLDEALIQLKRAVELSTSRNEDNAVIRDHLGDVYSGKRMNKEALRQWKKSLELDPQNDKVRKKIKKIQKKNKTGIKRNKSWKKSKKSG